MLLFLQKSLPTSGKTWVFGKDGRDFFGVLKEKFLLASGRFVGTFGRIVVHC